MLISILFHKLKSFILFIISVVNKALCCFRRRRCEEPVLLTDVGVVSNDGSVTSPDIQDWSNWLEDNIEVDKPKTIQDHIEIYRKQKAAAQQKYEDDAEAQLNFFEDMTPQIAKPPTHVIIVNSQESHGSSKLNFDGDAFSTLGAKELGEWEESSGWEGETLDWDAQQALREKKRQDRERRALEKQQKRQEKITRSLGAKVSS